MRRDRIPGPRFPRLELLYDVVMAWLLPERRFKSALLRQAGPQPGHRILDFGCGTGTLALMLKSRVPGADITGVDVNPRAISIATNKLSGPDTGIRFQLIPPGPLPFPDNSFDRVVSSLVFRHLDKRRKVEAMGECRRVLRPGGEFHIADWGKPSNWMLRIAFLLGQLLDGFKLTRDNRLGLLPELLSNAGFTSVEQTAHFGTLFGSLRLLQARKPFHAVARRGA